MRVTRTQSGRYEVSVNNVSGVIFKGSYGFEVRMADGYRTTSETLKGIKKYIASNYEKK